MSQSPRSSSKKKKIGAKPQCTDQADAVPQASEMEANDCNETEKKPKAETKNRKRKPEHTKTSTTEKQATAETAEKPNDTAEQESMRERTPEETEPGDDAEHLKYKKEQEKLTKERNTG